MAGGDLRPAADTQNFFVNFCKRHIPLVAQIYLSTAHCYLNSATIPSIRIIIRDYWHRIPTRSIQGIDNCYSTVNLVIRLRLNMINQRAYMMSNEQTVQKRVSHRPHESRKSCKERLLEIETANIRARCAVVFFRAFL